MKLWEAIKAMEEGHKVKKTSWHEDCYIYKGKDGIIRDDENAECVIQDFDSNWEIYKEKLDIGYEWKDFYVTSKNLYRKFKCDMNCSTCVLNHDNITCLNLDIKKIVDELEKLNTIYKLNR